MVVVEEKVFISGVVEGFYGRPWTCSQRKELFSRMRRNSMNTYIYAPKDDVKHRALWRQLYTKAEEHKLETLIKNAADEGVIFVYAISPGLDISFASDFDINLLKKKMKQVSKLGCSAFALLFDDINPTLKPSDAAVFKSSAQAQASIGNELFVYLKKPRFLFCPTEYCKTRAVPDVKRSEYLNTLGSMLLKEIDVMWTGDKVIPEVISKESIQELGIVLQRKPVIWDNIHANDYDQRRMFLGAYCGRSIELYPYLNGILTNPNCEFEANYIAIHTLGSWCRIAGSLFNNNEAVTFDDVPMVDLSDEEENVHDDTSEMPVDLLPSLTVADVTSVVSQYNRKEALQLAIYDWMDEFRLKKKAPLKLYSKRNLKSTVVNGQTVLSAVSFELDPTNSPLDTVSGMLEDKSKSMELTVNNVVLLADLFFLPYEHGERGVHLLEEFSWLLQNVHYIHEQPPSKEKVSKWFDRLLHCDQLCNNVFELFRGFCKIPNEAILYDLYPYIWDLKEVVLTLQAYAHWLSDSISSNIQLHINPLQNVDFSMPDMTIIGDYVEPWHINYLGGLTVHLHRLLPFKGGYLFLDNAPDVPSSNVVKIRSYCIADKEILYKFCSTLYYKDEVFGEQHIEFIGDKMVGPYLFLCAKTFFVVEDNNGLCGYIASTSNNKQFTCDINEWILSMKEKYPDCELSDLKFPSFAEWQSETSSHVVMGISERLHNECVVKRILNSVLCVLKTCGSTNTYYELADLVQLDAFMKMGFNPVENTSKKLLFRIL